MLSWLEAIVKTLCAGKFFPPFQMMEGCIDYGAPGAAGFVFAFLDDSGTFCYSTAS
jgi:hypothetical protein